MSHVVTIETKLRDPAAIHAACARLKLPEPKQETVKFFDGAEHTGLAVRPPGFVYPVLIQQDGAVRCDTYEGRWGDDGFVNRLKQAYAVEAAKLQAEQRGHRITETPLPDGGIKLTVTAGAGGFDAHASMYGGAA